MRNTNLSVCYESYFMFVDNDDCASHQAKKVIAGSCFART